ncbi:hypothetical protein Hanom_Chr07g00592371 [Helianthus anomalus]
MTRLGWSYRCDICNVGCILVELCSEQLSAVEENEGRLYRQDCVWEKSKESSIGDIWEENKKSPLSMFNDKRTEINLWKWKMANPKTRIVSERTMNVKQFRTIGIIQMFERLGWEIVLDWCEDITPRVYLASVCEWLASLRFENKDGPPHTWKLVGDTRRG